MADVDVIVTTEGGRETARAVRRGGGLVGLASNHTPPPDVPIDFVDWPFATDDPSVDRHIEVVREQQPKYAVAPDVDADWPLEDALEVADELSRNAQTVIVIPKLVHPSEIPRRFRVGMPFRDNFETPLGVNTFAEFSSAASVHLLGGNPTDHFAVADRFGLDVGSIDSPTPLAWADFGRVWLARRRGADEVDELTIEDIEEEGAFVAGLPTLEELERSRFRRIEFTIRNLIQAWKGREVTITAAVEPGRGPHPVPPKGSGLLGPAETFEEREEMRERFMAAAENRVLGEVDVEERLVDLSEFVDDKDDE